MSLAELIIGISLSIHVQQFHARIECVCVCVFLSARARSLTLAHKMIMIQENIHITHRSWSSSPIFYGLAWGRSHHPHIAKQMAQVAYKATANGYCHCIFTNFILFLWWICVSFFIHNCCCCCSFFSSGPVYVPYQIVMYLLQNENCKCGLVNKFQLNTSKVTVSNDVHFAW